MSETFSAFELAHLQPGDILLFKIRPGLDLWGRVITSEERDTDVCHAAYVGQNGEIWSTGTRKLLGMPMLFGSVDAESYCKGRPFYVARFDNLTPTEIFTMHLNGIRCTGMRYGMEKVILLTQRSRFGGIVHRLYPWLTKIVTHPFCSEQVSDSCWRAGRRICEAMGKEEPSAITPANIKSWADRKDTDLRIVGEVNA